MKERAIRFLTAKHVARGILGLILLVLFRTSGMGDSAASNSDIQTYLAQHHYIQVATSAVDVNAQQIEATINGRRANLIVDTGCAHTCLTYDCARHLHLNIVDTGHKALGVGGPTEGNIGMALIGSFIVGGCEINRVNTIQVLPQSTQDIGRDCDGLLGLDYLQLNAGILVVGSRGIIIKPGMTPVASIANYMKGLGFTGVPLAFRSGILVAGGHLDGTPFNALVDTGASFSTFDETLVKTALQDDPIYMNFTFSGVDGRKVRSDRFTPDALDFGSFKVPPIKLTTSTLRLGKKSGLGAILGFDLLALHLAVIDLGSYTLWMK